MIRPRCGAGWRRTRIAVAATACFLGQIDSARGAEQAAYPSRAIRLVVSFSAGGTSDTLARMLGEQLESAFAQPVVIENRPGASGNIASELVARAPPDGYTLLVGGNGITILPSTHGERAVDPVRAFAPVTKLVTQPILIATNPALPVATLAQLVALAQTEPGRLAYASAGIGTTDHLAAALLWTRAKVDLLHVPYANNGAEVKDLIQGEVKVAFITLGAVRQLLLTGQINALAVTTQRRVAAFPDVPTVAESGFAGYEVTSWYGVLAPAGTPPEIVNRLHREIVRVLQLPAIREKIVALGAEPVGNMPEQFADEIKSLVSLWAPVVRAAGIAAQ
jgi:tripartite-type tricarboxylate transporter receptor subunit TctC